MQAQLPLRLLNSTSDEKQKQLQPLSSNGNLTTQNNTFSHRGAGNNDLDLSIQQHQQVQEEIGQPRNNNFKIKKMSEQPRKLDKKGKLFKQIEKFH